MKEQTARILKGFIDSMKKDPVGWNSEVIGEESYQLYTLLENPDDIKEDGK